MANNRAAPQTSQQAQWFSVYKPTQGYWTRLGTAVGSGAFVLWGAHWLFEKLEVYRMTETGLFIQLGVPGAWIVAFGLMLYWLIGRNSKTVDFFIAVEGEMKKVNWSTKQEVIGATKVVMLFVLLVSMMLFVVDAIFMIFFRTIGVLKLGEIGSFTEIIRGLFGGG